MHHSLNCIPPAVIHFLEGENVVTGGGILQQYIHGFSSCAGAGGVAVPQVMLRLIPLLVPFVS